MRALTRSPKWTWIAAAGLWSLFLAFLGLHLITPSDGARFPPDEPKFAGHGPRLEMLRPGSLRSGDVLLAVDGRSLASLAGQLTQWQRPGAQWTFGQTLQYTVERDGAVLEVPVTLGRYPLGGVLAANWGSLLFAVILQSAMALVFIKRPAEPLARALFLTSAAMVAATSWSLGLQVSDLVVPAGFWLFATATIGGYLLVWAGMLHTLLLFPTHWPPLARQRWLAPALYAAPYLGLLAVTVVTRRPNAMAWLQSAGLLTNYVQGGYVLLALAATVRSVRAAHDPVSRAQVRWVVTGFVMALCSGLTLGVIPELVLGYPLLSWEALALIGLAVPLAFGVAILRYRLFDIDVLLNRTLVYGGLTIGVTALYVLVVGGLGEGLRARQPGSNLALSLLATGLVAVSFQPLRQRLQRTVNRLVYGERDDPYAVLSRLSQRLEATLAPEAVLPTLAETIAQALKLPYVAVALQRAGTSEPQIVAAYGLPAAQTLRWPLTYQSEAVGELRVAPRGPSETFTSAEQQLLADIAHQAGVAAHAVQLTADLQHSRQRLVGALEEERRRLRRDLHDGLGPQLSSQTLTLTAARELLHQHPAEADALLAEAIKHAQAAVTDIRRVVYGLRPPALDDLGLAGALRAQAAEFGSSGVHFTISTPNRLPPLPAAVEVACYRIAQEALTNVVKHAQAQNCTVSLAVDGALSLEVADDGRGLALDRRAGVGLSSMCERAAELGGECQVTPRPAGGTRVLARLPLG
jgi:signal transduction histidine kinase